MSATRRVLVLMESLAGSGHKRVAIKNKQDAGKLQAVQWDPIVMSWVLYQEKEKIRTLSKQKMGLKRKLAEQRENQM